MSLAPLPRRPLVQKAAWAAVNQGCAGRERAAWASPELRRRLQGPGPAPLLLCPADFPGGLTLGEPPTRSPPWENALVGKITAMSVIEKRLLLEAIRQCIQEQNQVGPGTLTPCSLLLQGHRGSHQPLRPLRPLTFQHVGGQWATQTLPFDAKTPLPVPVSQARAWATGSWTHLAPLLRPQGL